MRHSWPETTATVFIGASHARYVSINNARMCIVFDTPVIFYYDSLRNELKSLEFERRWWKKKGVDCFKGVVALVEEKREKISENVT